MINKNKILPRENDNQLILVEDVRRTDMKICPTCEIEKSYNEFYNNYKKNPHCKVCFREKQRKAYKANPSILIERTKQFRKNNPEKIRGYNLKREYNMSIEEYNFKLQEQNYCCEICGKHENDNIIGGKLLPLAVDHNHIINMNRGLLCCICNLAFGLLKEDISIFQNMINYFNKYQKLR